MFPLSRCQPDSLLPLQTPEKSNGSNEGGPTQRASALAALSSAFNPSSGTTGSKTTGSRPSGSGQGTQRAAAVAALSAVLTAEKKSEGSPGQSNRSPPPETSPSAGARNLTADLEAEATQGDAEVKETVESHSESSGVDSATKEEAEQDKNGSEGSQTIVSYDQLRAKSDYPITGIDFKRREAYLSEEEFQSVFGMAKEAFYKLPKWKQDMQKKKVDLF